eukprot:3136726-Rhodomonas_salina.6
MGAGRGGVCAGQRAAADRARAAADADVRGGPQDAVCRPRPGADHHLVDLEVGRQPRACVARYR